MWAIMTYRGAKLYMLCVCYSLQELKGKREVLLAGKRLPVPSKLIDTAGLDEVEEAIQEYGSERFVKERELLPGKHSMLVAAFRGPDRDMGKALERGIRGLCVHERKEDLQGRLDGTGPGVDGGCPWSVAGDAGADELGLAVALYDDTLYRHLRDLAGKVELERISGCNDWELRSQEEDLLSGEESRRSGSGWLFMVPVERLAGALEKYGEPRYVFFRRWMTREYIRFEDGVHFYFITDRFGVGTLIAGLVTPSVMIKLFGMVCLEESDPRRVAGFFAKNFHFNIVVRDEPVENVAAVQYGFSGLTNLIGAFEHGDEYEILCVNVHDVADRFADKDMADMVRSIDWKKCSKRLFSKSG